MNRFHVIIIGLVLAIINTGCTSTVDKNATPLVRQRVPVVYIQAGSPIKGVKWILGVMTNGTLRDGGFIVNDEMLATGVRIMHDEMAIVLLVDQPEDTTLKSIQTALNRVQAALQRDLPNDAQVTIYLQYSESPREGE